LSFSGAMRTITEVGVIIRAIFSLVVTGPATADAGERPATLRPETSNRSAGGSVPPHDERE
jgi:hypothetical protein